MNWQWKRWKRRKPVKIKIGLGTNVFEFEDGGKDPPAELVEWISLWFTLAGGVPTDEVQAKIDAVVAQLKEHRLKLDQAPRP